jgi:hypothetical protein
MLQRIQSLYLLLITGLLIAGMCLPIGYFYSELDNERAGYAFRPLGVDIGNGFYSTWGLFVIILLCTGITLVTIFFYKKRILQIRVMIFNSVLLIGYYLAILAFYLLLKSKLEIEAFRMSWTLCFPAIAIVLNYLAIRAIGRDEVMVKAVGRLR